MTRRRKSEDPEKAKLDKEVVTQMVQSGIMNHVQARAVVQVAEVVQRSPFIALKPYRKFKQTPTYGVAATLVASFLFRRHLQNTVQCVKIEASGLLPQRQDLAMVAEHLSLVTQRVQLTAFIEEWLEMGEGWVAANREVTLRKIDERMAELSAPAARPRARDWKTSDISEGTGEWNGL
jgi:cobyrinic acid a,c-diamide synthase